MAKIEVKIGDTYISEKGYCQEKVVCIEKPIEDTKHCKHCIYNVYGYGAGLNFCNQFNCFDFERKDKKNIIFRVLQLWKK